MAIALTNLAVCYTALCIWLTVRIVNRRERWAKWTLLGTTVGIPALYVLSFGPACWMNERTSKEFILDGAPSPGTYWDSGIGDRVFRIAYEPFFKHVDANPLWRSALIRWYAEIGTRNASLRLPGDDITWYRPPDDPPRVVE